MRRLNLVLLAATQLASARSPGFSIHEDLLTYPQFDVLFSDEYISQSDANALLEKHGQHPTYSAEFSQSTLNNVREADAGDEAADGANLGDAFTYELMKMPPHQYLCSIPVIQPPSPENKTANELAKAEEARELVRATNSGWELIADLEDTCLYFMSGWWSYSFCNNRKITQFHALPSIPNGQPPKRDPNTAYYVLGEKPTLPPSSAYQAAKQDGEESPPPAELQVKGDQRYLVQRLEGGTECDLTGRDRTIEVQYHCVPGLKNDRIGWIKEVTICAYLMVINTPRLCNDVAFLPPEETKANPINCQLILDDNTIPPLLEQDSPYDDALAQEQQEAEGVIDVAPVKKEINVGGVIVGARNVLSGADEDGKPPIKLAPPKSYFDTSDTDIERFIEVVASGKSTKDGGEVTSMTDAEMEKNELKVSSVREMIERMRKLAGKYGWKLELVELPNGVRELRGYIDEPAEKGEGTAKSGGKKGGEQGDTRGDKQDEGSEEKFYQKDEL